MLSEPALLLLWGGSAVGAMTFAMGRDRNPLLWLFAALAAGPAAPLLLLALPPVRRAAPALDREAMELCDACLEPVRRDRRQCRHCGAMVPADAPHPRESRDDGRYENCEAAPSGI